MMDTEGCRKGKAGGESKELLPHKTSFVGKQSVRNANRLSVLIRGNIA